MNDKKQKHDKEDKKDKKKKRVLLGLLFGILGAGAIATAIAVPLVLLNKKDPEPELKTMVIKQSDGTDLPSEFVEGQYETLELAVFDEDGEITGKNVSYKSSNLSVATVSGATISFVGTGSTTITADCDGYEQANAQIIVTKPVVAPEFDVDTGATMWDPIYSTLKLNWTPAADEIEFSNFSFAYGTKTVTNIKITDTESGSVSLKLTFDEPIVADDIEGTLSFHYVDTSSTSQGDKSISNINIAKYVPPVSSDFTYEEAREPTELKITGYQGTSVNMVVPSYIYTDNQWKKSCWNFR